MDELPAGKFSRWLAEATDPTTVDVDVPCGTCTACCRSSYFIHVAPDESDSLAHIPKALLFPAPGRPRGHQVMGFDERGHCPMLRDDGCSIYEHRPRTCRSYDCRVFAAADLSPAADGKQDIAERVARWRFTIDDETDELELAAVRAAASFLVEHRAELFASGEAPTSAGQLASLALKIHRAFLRLSPAAAREPDVDAVRAALDEALSS